uniref:Zinc finger BED domain-containing protein RICESLEEPER 2-like n=1 Tax=Tanacetum cinerariifolium TaxID=118510 RepID=A0A699KWD6_TANCI|nr:zinc finger BED domain-containing protein RICESLEEPER 2-like [Tanacetum cinerariifolium]
MNINDESDDLLKEIGKPTQSEGVGSTSSYAKIYGNDSPQLAKVKEVLYGVFDEYNLASKNKTKSTSGGGCSEMNSQVDEGNVGTSQSILKEFDLFDKNESLSLNEKQRKLDF